jgi:hypothetical protein
MHGIDLIGLVAPQLRPREVADLSGIGDAHDVPNLMECERDAQAVAPGCLQTGVNLSDLVLAEPGKSGDASHRVNWRSSWSAPLCQPRGWCRRCSWKRRCPVQRQSFQGFLFRSSQRRLRIDQPCTQDLRQNASQDTVQPKQRSLEKRSRIYRSGLVAKGTAQAHRFSRHPAEMIIRRTLATYKGQESAAG